MASKATQDICDKKSKEAAKRLRLKGNAYYQKRQLNQALSEYNQGILLAPHDDADGSEELALAFANRSAVFYQTSDWKGCLRDIQQAMNHQYPAHNQYKLHRRKTQCLIQLQRFQEAAEALQVAKSEVENNTNLLQEEKDNVDKELQKLFGKLNLKQKVAVESECRTQDKYDFVESNKIYSASSDVALKYSTSKGRHLVVEMQIPAGSTVIKEKPFAGVLLPSCHMTHCHQCFAETKAPIPCPLCTKVRYCSDICQQRAMTSYHWAECPYWNLLQHVGTFAHLSFRILLVAGLENIKEQLKNDSDLSRETSNLIPGCSSDNHYLSNYKAVWNLMTNADMHSPEILKKFQKLSTEIIENTIDHLMSSETWISHNSTSIKMLDQSHDQERQYLIGQLGKALYRHLLQLHCNAHAVTSVDPSDSGGAVVGRSVVDVEQKRIATAVFPTISLLNHSCNPNVIVSFKDDEIIVRTTRTIGTEEELLHCYGPHYKHMEKKVRQEALMNQYNFKCSCIACMNEGDMMSNDEGNIFEAYRCVKCSQPVFDKGGGDVASCSGETCQEKLNLKKAKKNQLESVSLFSMATKLLEESKIQDSLEVLMQCCNMQSRILYKYNRSLSETQDCLARCYAMLGDFGSASKYLQQSISTVEKRFGSDSIEFANELHKLAQVQFNMQDVEGAIITINKCLPLLTCYYGNSHDTVKELIQMKEVLKCYKK
ncbi:SET and MYND domain-containing protein 4-like isoform X1 [Anneissia japonica]|uniref:SET and MYND domain-containing protein 4-like isoform X1 n=1 Tax=Anneissia japonica TaxID=1529436 RepID=UPI00142574E8|nr:SET and MYND domain-containing protein 4-like isoform X1 [Anneissia japonica]